MRISFLGHACHLVEIGGRRILTDPWLIDPIFEGRVGHAPPLGFAVTDLPRPDVIAITHAHLDHFNAPTLGSLPDKDLPVLIPVSRFTELEANLRLLGFTDVRSLKDWEAYEIGDAKIVATPAEGVLDECAWLIEGDGERFFDGADAPLAPGVLSAIRSRFGPVDVAALGGNSFSMPALLGLPSLKDADHGPIGASRAASLLGAAVAFPAASNMEWLGDDGADLTSRVIRRSAEQVVDQMRRIAPDVSAIHLAPGDAFTREGGIERNAISGFPAPRARHDYIHAHLSTGRRHCPEGRPTTEETWRRDLPALLAAAPERSLLVGGEVTFFVTGDDVDTFSIDFAQPGTPAFRGDRGGDFAVSVHDKDWKDLFERRASWQVLLSSDRLRVERFRPGAPPVGLNFVYALQAVFP